MLAKGRSKHMLHLHFLVFIAGFTAILGELITIEAIPLVWFRMLIATVLMFLYIKIKKVNLKITKTKLVRFFLAGIAIALHWITFFASIKVSNISIALAMFSTGALFAALLEPLFYNRKIRLYEIFLGILIILGVYIIIDSELKHLNGILLGITAAFFSSLFAVINGKFVEKDDAAYLSFYEFIGGVLFISLYIFFFGGGFTQQFFELQNSDWLYLFLLASVCTAYAFIASTYVMKYITPFTVVLTYNLEPIYGVILAIIIFRESEIMSINFYIGAILILITVVLNAWLKNKTKINNLKNNQTTNG